MVETMVEDKKLEEIQKEKAEKLKKNMAKRRAQGRGSGIPPGPPKQPPMGSPPPMNFEQIAMQQIQSLGKRVQQLDQGLQKTMQMVNMLARPDLALQPVVDSWRRSFCHHLIIGFHEGFKIALVGTIDKKLSAKMSGPDKGTTVIDTDDQGFIQINNEIIRMVYTKTEEMIENDKKRKVEQERERKRQAKQKGPTRNDNSTPGKPTEESGNRS